jgi:tRNA-Thr(GGU) m(6)t(6)A37 methyltransferase TsaA
MAGSLQLFPVGVVTRTDDAVWIEIFDQFSDALLGLDKFSHIHVLYWFHDNDNTGGRNTLQVHPRGDTANPITGVFATHSSSRPNLIGLSICKVLSVEGNRIRIDAIDALAGSPVIDIKCFIPNRPEESSVNVPDWAMS